MSTTTRAVDRRGSAPAGLGPAGRARSARVRRQRRGVLTWLLRLVRHRSWAQVRLLAVAGLVALLVAAEVATLAVLAGTSERLGVPATLLADAGRTRLTLTIGGLDRPLPEVVAHAERALTETLGVPVTTEVQATSPMYDVARPGKWLPGYAYVDRRDGVEDAAEIVAGTWPTSWAGGDEPVPVAVPAGGARALGIDLGETWTLEAQRDDGTDVVVRVVGLYDVPAPDDDHWSRDRLGGVGYEPDYPVPFSAGFLTTEAVGPFVVSAEAADAGAFEVRRAVVRADPDLTGVRAGDLPRLRRAVAGLAEEVAFRLEDDAGEVGLGSALSRVLREAATGVVVTRAGVAVATVLLLLVAVAALLQSARLVSEARAAEHDLLRARGASRGQVLAAVTLEAALLGVGVAALAPPIGLLGVRLLGGPLADAVADPLRDPLGALRALPGTAWAAGGIVAALLVVVSVVPLLRAPATFVEGQQARGRRGRRGSLARLAADLVAVGAAALGWTQLRAYGGLLVGSGERLAVDPVLAVGPALLLLAAALVGVRVLPLAGAALERLARRGRGLVVPLAGWDVGRRSHHAGAAVLLLTLAIGASTFGLTQRATWQRSQEDQAAFVVGPPVVVEDAHTAAVDARALAVAGADPQPVLRDDARVVRRTADEGGEAVSGMGVELVAAPGPARATLDRGRLADEGGTEVAALPAAPPSGGVPLGDDVLGLQATVEISGRLLHEATALSLRAILEDEAGALSTVSLGQRTALETEEQVAALLPDVRLPVAPESQQASADALAEAVAGRSALRLVGVQAFLVATDNALLWAPWESYDLTVEVRDLAVLRPAGDVAAVPAERWASGLTLDAARAGIVADPLEIPAGGWTPIGDAMGGEKTAMLGDGARLHFIGTVNLLPEAPAIGALVAWEPVEDVPAVLTADLVERLRDATTRGFEIRVSQAAVRAVVADVVPWIPATSGGSAVAVDHTTLARAVLQRGGLGPFVDEWWVDAADPEAYLAALPPDLDGTPRAARATSIDGAVAASLEHPVRVAVPLVLALLALGAALVAGIGFVVHTAVTVRERDLELAQLRAVGLTRGRLTAALALESGMLAGLGVVLGVGTGAGVAALVGHLLVVAPDGGPPIPPVELVVPPTVGWLAAGIVAVVAALTLAVAAAQRTADPASLLRAGDGR